MKILHLIYTHGVSGAEKYLKHLLPGLKRYGVDCDLIVVCPKAKAQKMQEYCDSLNEQGIKATLLISSRLSFFITAKKISTYLKTNTIGILHSHLVNSDILASIIKTLFLRKLFLISTKHGYQEKFLQQYDPGKKYKPLNDLYYYITKYTLRKINRNVAVSKALADLYYNIQLTKTHYPYIHHGVTIDSFDKKVYENECRKARYQLIIVGRIEVFKGHRFLIQALPLITAAFPDIKLLVLGEGSEKDACLQQVKQLGLESKVEFLGFKPHPYSYISNSDIVILPSLFEPFGLVYIEAFALKIPVVAFNTPAGNEIMEDNKTALLVNKGDIASLAEKIIYLLKNVPERDEMAEAAYVKYKNNFTTEVMIKNTVKWYKETLVDA